MESTNNLRKRLYQNLLHKEPKQNHLLGSDVHTKSAILKPKVALQAMNTTVKLSPVFNRGKILMENKFKSPEIPKKMAPIPVKDKLSKQGKAVIQQGKLKSKANLKPHDIFAFYQAFPQMSQDFFYLNRVSHPYDYQIVTYSQRNPMQYMTISFKGVTLYHQKQAQFLTKQEWLADEKIYYSLQKIDFFKQYKISKNFTIWKNRMRRHYMKEMSNLLNESLFFSYQYPRYCLLKIRKATNHLKDDTYFMPTSIIEALQPKEYQKNAEEYIEHHFVKVLKQTEDLIAEHLQEAIEQQIKQFKLQNNIKINDVGDCDQKEQKQGYVYSQQAILRKQYKKVNRLIKLADNILVESKIQLLNQCLFQLLEKIEQVKNSDSKSQWIKCTAELVQGQGEMKRIRWNPTLEGLKGIFRDIINLAVTKMSDLHEKVGSREKFQKYRSAQQNQSRKDQKRNTLKYIIEQSPFYQQLISRINFQLQQQFKKTQKQQIQLSKYIDIYSKHRQLPQIGQIFRQHSAAEYIQLVREWRQDNDEMHSLPMSKNDGLLLFDYTMLRADIHQVPKKTLGTFLSQLPQQTKKKYNYLVRQSEVHLQQINNYPINMEEFVQFNQAVKKATFALDQLIDGSKSLIQMVALIEQNKTPSSDFNRINPKKATQNINKLKAKVDESNAKYDQSLSKFKKQLQTRVSRVKTMVKQLTSKFEVIPFDNITSQITPTLQRLNQIFPLIQKLQQQSLAIQQIEWQLSLPTNELDEVHALYQRSIDVKNLWECKEKWNDLLLGIFHKHYKQIDCKELKNSWQEFSKKNTELQKSLPDNQVLKKLIGQIAQFENLLQTIVSLTSPNLQQKSWKQISQYLAYELNIEDENKLPFVNRDDPQYTVEWLINKNISLYKQKISFIVQKSQKEKQLQSSLTDFRVFISTIVFETVTKKREVVLIQSNTQLRKSINQKISTLYSLIRNQYSDSLKNQAEVMIKHYQYLEEIMQGMYTFREEWEKYEPFFQNNAVSTKLLTKEAKEFSSWELQWKKIIKNITNDPAYFYRKICDQTMGVNCSRAILKSISKTSMFLDLVKKGVQQFLQKKRTQFPRYCLFTDTELLSILSRIDHRHLIVPQIITTLYDNIKSIEYDQESGAVLSVMTNQDEKLMLVKQSNFKLQSEMEDLLKITEDQIKKSMGYTIRAVFGKYIEEEITREALITDNLAQIALQVDFIAWVRLAQQTYLVNDPVGTFDDWLGIQQQQINQLSSLIHTCKPSHYFKYIQFMVQSLYFRQKTLTLKAKNITDTSFYEWERIPKMIKTNNDIHLRQLDSKISYSYEILNQQEVVVIHLETERVWVNLINALSIKEGKNVVGLRGDCVQAIKDLAFYLGQSIRSLHFPSTCNIKTAQRLLTGCMHIGIWMHFAPISNPQILSYIAYHINSGKRSSNFQAMTSALQLTKNATLNNSFTNAVFLFEQGERFVEMKFVDSKCFRNVTLHKPNEQYVVSVLCQAQEIPKQIGTILLNICEFCKNTFEFSKTITESFIRSILKEIKDEFLPKLSNTQIKDPQVLGFITFYVVSGKLLTYFTPVDYQLFHTFKTSFLTNYQAMKTKFIQRISQQKNPENHQVNKYLESFTTEKHLYTKQFINQAIKAYDMIMNDQKLGVIVSGQILSGKSQLISFIESVYRFKLKKQQQHFEVNKIYPNAYQFSDIIKSYSQERKERKEKQQKLDRSQKQKPERVNQDWGILQSFLVSQKTQKWIVIDGKVQNGIIQFLNDNFDEILVSNYGLISKQKNKKHKLQRVNIIIETLNSSNFSPSSFYNYSVCHISPLTNTVEAVVKQYFQKENVKKYLKGLSEESICYIEQQLIINLTKVEQKGNIKSKALQFLYSFSENQITLKCLKLVECVFKLNQESIREKEKNMKKTVEKFVQWCILIVLYLHVSEESQAKLEKRFMEVCKCENSFQDSVIKYIIYPGSGIEVQPMNGLRTQSCLFEIPQRGIVTSITTTDFNDFNNFMNSKPNKLYEEISLETISTIRVNHDESNLFNYYSQLFAYSNLPTVLTGPVGTGKKSLLELYAKNIRHRAFIYSLRYHRSLSIMENFEKPFRKYNSLEGVVLKSPVSSKDVVILIDDLNLVEEEKSTLEFFRMLTNENGFVNKNGKLRKLTEDNNNISILTNCRDSSESVVRLSSRLIFFQTARNTIEKLSSIFSPYLKAWSKANSLQGEIDRIFSSQNGDTLLDATLKIFEFMEEMFKSKKSQKDFSMDTMLLKPRIGDITKVLSCICLTQDAKKYTLGYYADLWANEIMRVFQDRLSPSQKNISKSLLQVVKKEFFLKFKQNFHYNSKQLFIFSSYLSGENRLYQRVYDLQQLQQMIENAYESHTITVPVRLFFSQLLKEILKVYRVLEITNGHMILFHINRKVRHYLLQLGSQVAEAPLLHMKKSLLTPERDILSILQFQDDVSIFEDLDDMTDEQIYQFTCLVNRNNYQFEMKPQIREKIKIKMTKYLRQLVNQISSARENSTPLQKVRGENVKDKQSLYINQKLEEQLESTMQEIIMNNVHFLFGASPTNPKTKKFLLNEIDLVGEMHLSFFDIPEESLMEIAKQTLTLEDIDEGAQQSQKVIKTKQEMAQIQKQAENIMNDCLKIYHSLSEKEKNYNSLLTICENIMTDRLKLKQETLNHVTQLEKSIQNYQKALQFITENETKLEQSLSKLQLIKNEQSILSQKLQIKTNEINELQLNINQNEEINYENSQKKLFLEQKNQQLAAIQEQLREIKMKKDKNDIETRQARKMIQLSKDYVQLIMDVTTVQKKLEVQKQILANIQKLLALWWSMVIYSSNRQTEEIIERLNEWIELINFKENFRVNDCQDIIEMFELIIAPLAGVIPALASISAQGKFKVLLLMFIIYRHDETISENRIITLYDPCKVYPSVFKFFPIDSQLGNYALGQTISKYDDDFWSQIEKLKRGLIFLDKSIESRQKKQIQAHIIKRRIFHLNRFVALVDKKQKADITFVFEKTYFINHLKLQSLMSQDTTLALQIAQAREDFMKESRRLREMKKNLRSKIADIKFEMETDTEELSRLQRDIGLLQVKIVQYQTKVSLQNLRVSEEKIITKIIDQLYKNANDDPNNFNHEESQIFSLPKIQKLHRTMREIILRFVSDLRQKSDVLHRMHRKNSLEMPQLIQQQLGDRRSLRPSMHSIQVSSQALMSLPRSQFEFSKQQQQMVDQLIERVILNNFSQSKKLFVNDQDLFNIEFMSLQLQNKVPIIIIPNNLPNQQLIIGRQHRPVNLLYNNLSTITIDSPVTVLSLSQSGEDKGTPISSSTGKVFLFYNDEVHFNALVELTYKYLEQYRSMDKKYCVYLFTNVAFEMLRVNEDEIGSSYKIFYYQQQEEQSHQVESTVNTMTDKSTKAQLFIRLSQHLTHYKSYNNNDIQRYSEYLLSKVPPQIEESISIAKTQLNHYLLDVGFGVQGEEEMIRKIINEQICWSDVNAVVNDGGKGGQEKKKAVQGEGVVGILANSQKQRIGDCMIELRAEFSQETFEQLSQEIPNLFNPSQFFVPNTKDSLCFQVQNFALNLNKKLRFVKSLLQRNLDRSTLSISKLSDSYSQQGLYPVPTSQYIQELNTEYKSIRRLLGQNGLLMGPQKSMNKIPSTKGLGSSIVVAEYAKNGMFIDQQFFNLRVINQLKVRASKKLKIPYSRVGLLFILETKTQGLSYSSPIQKMIINTPPELLLAMSAEIINSEFKQSTIVNQDEKESTSRFAKNKRAFKKKNGIIRLLALPYDTNNFTQILSYFNPLIATEQRDPNLGRRKTLFGDVILKREDTMKDKIIVETTKLKIFYCSGQSEEKGVSCNIVGQQIGTMQLPSNELFTQYPAILIPFVQLKTKSQ